ncbi:mycothiol system anti-sigma-R factor [Algoriphagus antarcticus]|uniref:Mycothiol system anti-sigma-R factor n=1 Tax=Algoriphagus antarcticus TaxID=238540 RepID=A0A3E0DQQ1_9BACT|nr:mycothiol system anti-sigma-R factor [Algoriphagus antarcticus]REG85457.1 mycothiol system anti-sigma-R factor [Algoriphagus antarcticus]
MEMKENASGERKTQCSDESKCFELLESILDGEMIDSGKEVLKEKLAKCQPCFEHYHLEQAIRDVLKTKCTKQAVPTELADSIRKQIQDIK